MFFACFNTTTVDNLSRRTRIYHFAVLLPSHNPDNLGHSVDEGRSRAMQLAYPTITYPLPASHPLATSNSPPHSHPRTFAILATRPGVNPYKLPTGLQNFKSVMGTNILDWLLPLRPSPSYSRRMADAHDLEAGAANGGRSMYELGPEFAALCTSAGVDVPAGVVKAHPRQSLSSSA